MGDITGPSVTKASGSCLNHFGQQSTSTASGQQLASVQLMLGRRSRLVSAAAADGQNLTETERAGRVAWGDPRMLTGVGGANVLE